MSFTRRLLLSMGALLAFGTAAATAFAEDYPDRPITWVVPYGAGSSSDLVARLLADKVGSTLGQRVLVENKPGGSGLVGTEQVLRADPDGYTLILASNSTHAVAVSLFNNLKYDPAEDFASIALLTSQPQVVVVNPSLGVKTVSELITYAKAHPGELNYASTGIGTGAHLAPATFNIMAGIDILHVPYQGGGKAIPELVAGRVQVMFYPYQPLKGIIDAGQLIPIATTGFERSPWLPDLPTMIELGYKDFAFPSWSAVMAPKGSPDDAVNKISSAFEQALKDPDVIKALADNGTVPTYKNPAGLKEFIKIEIERYRGVLKNAGVEKID